MATYKIKCPNCEHEFMKERIILFEKNKKEIAKTDVDKLAKPVKELIKELSTVSLNIKKITIISADRENQLQQKDNLGISLEVIVVPSPGPKP